MCQRNLKYCDCCYIDFNTIEKTTDNTKKNTNNFCYIMNKRHAKNTRLMTKIKRRVNQVNRDDPMHPYNIFVSTYDEVKNKYRLKDLNDDDILKKDFDKIVQDIKSNEILRYTGILQASKYNLTIKNISQHNYENIRQILLNQTDQLDLKLVKIFIDDDFIKTSKTIEDLKKIPTRKI